MKVKKVKAVLIGNTDISKEEERLIWSNLFDIFRKINPGKQKEPPENKKVGSEESIKS